MDLEMEAAELPQDYLSPRSKVAQMLADIDEAPTPSPSPGAGSLSSTKEPMQSHVQPLPTASSKTLPISHVSSDEEDASPARPMGRAARRMLGHQTQRDHDEEDLYSATPAKARYIPSRSVSESPSVRSQRSAGLFVSPAQSIGSEDGLPTNPLQSSRLAELVAAKRKERLDKEKAQRRAQKEAAELAARSDLPEEIVEEDTVAADPALERILSDAARPTRKASKKAMLEMERETQRIAREQALAHQMKTKKKFSTTDLFARFNFRQPTLQQQDSSSSAPNSDALGSAEKVRREPLSTPPSSPPTPWDTQKALVEHGALARMVPVREDTIQSVTSMAADDDDELPAIEDLLRQSRSAKSKGKQPIEPESPTRNTAASRLRSKLRNLPTQAPDSDEELDIVQPMPSHLRAFDKVRTGDAKRETQSRAIHILKHLAHLAQDNNTTVRGKKLKAAVPPDLVNAQLLASAKEHARKAQEQRLAELQAKGIVVMSVEEQEKEAGQIEDLIEKARREADEIRKKEKAAAKKNGDETQLAASDDEDEDWEGSEEEEDVLDEDDEEGETNPFLNEAAEEDADDSDEEQSEDDIPDTMPEPVIAEVEQPAVDAAPQLGHRKIRVIEDDEDEEDAVIQPTPITKANTQPGSDPFAVFGFGNVAPTPAKPPSSQQDDPFAAFGFGGGPGPALMSPTQAFAATMQTPTQNMASTFAGSANRGYFDSASRPPPPTFGQVQTQIDDDSQSQLVPASQAHEHTQAVALDWETQQLPETPMPEAKASSVLIETPGWEPSPDRGLPSPWTAARRGLNKIIDDDFDTQSTVRVRISESPEVVIQKPKGRLTRGLRIASSPEVEPAPKPIAKSTKNAFLEMQRKRMETLNAADRAAAEKEMLEMMDDQAYESEDEYAGLGGDDSNMIAPETEEDRAMIDHSNIEIDEDQAREMAKFYAERQRAAEEAATSKLFKDITTGALRRRQGVGWELDEDEDDLAARRRQMRLREEARKRKLLLEDDNVKGLVEGKGDSKGREAFLKTIGDDDDDFELEEDIVIEATQEDSQASAPAEPLQEISHNKRKLDDSQDNSQPTKIRRVKETISMSRPTSMVQVRESLSFLLDEPDHALYGPSALDKADESDYDSDHEVEDEIARDNDGGYAPDQVREMPPPPLPTDRLPATQRRTPARPAVIDRLSLRRGSSSSSSTSSTGWNAWSTNSGSSKVPSLLRRATTNMSASNANDRGVTYGTERRGSAPSAVKTGGSKKSSLAYQARAMEKAALVERSEKRKENERQRLAEIRRQQGGALAGGFASGQWE